ncbi:Uncharacterised protein [Mycobacteroides abscessus]|nr:Uncharacterised protein [Mycobacteroides abscessus]
MLDLRVPLHAVEATLAVLERGDRRARRRREDLEALGRAVHRMIAAGSFASICSTVKGCGTISE